MFGDLDGVYQSNEKCIEEQKSLERKLRQLEDNIVQTGKVEMNLKLELEDKRTRLGAAETLLRGQAEKLQRLEECERASAVLIREQETRLNFLDKELLLKNEFVAELRNSSDAAFLAAQTARDEEAQLRKRVDTLHQECARLTEDLEMAKAKAESQGKQGLANSYMPKNFAQDWDKEEMLTMIQL